MPELTLTGHDLTLKNVRDFTAAPAASSLGDNARTNMQYSVDAVSKAVAAGEPRYGINTGFGAFANQRISVEKVRELQYNLVRSHACGVGAFVVSAPFF